MAYLMKLEICSLVIGCWLLPLTIPIDDYQPSPCFGYPADHSNARQPTSFSSYSCNEYNTSTNLTIDTLSSSPSFIDLNGKEFRFSGLTSHGLYSSYQISPRSNECSN